LTVDVDSGSVVYRFDKTQKSEVKLEKAKYKQETRAEKLNQLILYLNNCVVGTVGSDSELCVLFS